MHLHSETALLCISRTGFSNQHCTSNAVCTWKQHISIGSTGSNVKVTEWKPIIKRGKNNTTPSSAIKLVKWLMIKVRPQRKNNIQKQHFFFPHTILFTFCKKVCSYFCMKGHWRHYSMWSESIRHRLNGAVSQKRCGEMKWKEGQSSAGIDPTCHTRSSWLLQWEGFGHITFVHAHSLQRVPATGEPHLDSHFIC